MASTKAKEEKGGKERRSVSDTNSASLKGASVHERARKASSGGLAGYESGDYGALCVVDVGGGVQLLELRHGALVGGVQRHVCEESTGGGQRVQNSGVRA